VDLDGGGERGLFPPRVLDRGLVLLFP